MRQYLDTAIVGASSAGLYTAELLARAGKRVAVFEQQPGLATNRRTLIITPHLARLLGFNPTDVIINTTGVMSVSTPEARIDVALQQDDVIIERCAFLRFLAARAEDAGATISYGLRFRGIAPYDSGESVTLSLSDASGEEHCILARAVVGADGTFSDVAKAVELPNPPAVPILQTETEASSNWNPSTTYVWFDTDETPYFFWMIPEAHDRWVAGLVSNHRADIHVSLQRFLRQHHLSPSAYQAAHVPLHHPCLRPWTRVGDVPILLVGDAAGQVKNTTVGGTVTGLRGAEALVRSLLHGTSYAKELQQLNRELDLHWLVRYTLNRMHNTDYDRLVQSLSPSVLRCLSLYTRDELATFFWRLLLLQPRLIGVGIRSLLRISF